MKFVKGAALFLVLFFAAIGVFSLFKKPPKIDVPESDISYLQDLGVHIQDGQASDSGLSAVLNDVQGVAPVGVTAGTSASSVPPSFLAEPAGSIADPFEAAPPVQSPPALETAPAFEPAPPFETAPRVASVETASISPLPPPSIAPEFSSPEAVVLPPPNIEIPTPQVPADIPPALAAPPIPITQSSPPDKPASTEWESWDGPASGISVTTNNVNAVSVTPPPVEPLQTSTPAPRPDTLPPPSEAVPYQPVVKNIRRISSDSQAQHAASSAPDTNYFSKNTAVVSDPPTPYTRTSVRQQLTFAPVKQEVRPNAPVVSFGHPKRYDQTPPIPTNGVPTAATQNVPSLSSVPEKPSPAHEMVKQFVQSQQQLIDSGSPENIRHAYVQLSQLFEHNLLGEPEKAMIQPILDSLALKVIYAKNSCILEPPYRVKPGETVESIARDFNLTPSLLRKMNGLAPNQALSAGATLKVVYGQFDARISVARRELTLLLGGLYAGRFAFSLPQTALPAYQGEFFVTNRADRSIVLNNGWILASASEPNATIVFSDKDSQEVFDILSEQSVIVLE